MKLALASEEDPLDANLQKVLPGVHERLNVNTATVELKRQAVVALDGKVDNLSQSIREGFREMAGAVHGMAGCTEQVGQSLINAGALLIQQQSPNRIGTSGFSLETPPLTHQRLLH